MSFVFQDQYIVKWFERKGHRTLPRKRFLLWLSYWLDYRLYGFDSKQWRGTSLMLHLMTASIIALLSPLAGTLFAVHPLTTMGWSYVSGRSGLLSGLMQFAVAGMALQGWYVTAIVATVVAIRWIKEDSIIFLPMIGCLWLGR
jgi:hypothetical protein